MSIIVSVVLAMSSLSSLTVKGCYCVGWYVVMTGRQHDWQPFPAGGTLCLWFRTRYERVLPASTSKLSYSEWLSVSVYCCYYDNVVSVKWSLADVMSLFSTSCNTSSYCVQSKRWLSLPGQHGLCVCLTGACCVYSQYEGGAGGGAGGSGYSYWPDHRHQHSTMMPQHQLAGPSTLEYRPPPRRGAYPSGPVHASVIPVMTDESALGVLGRMLPVISSTWYYQTKYIFTVFDSKLQWLTFN